jgi:hypothetical protein
MTFVNYLNRFLRSGDRVVVVVKDGYKLRYEFFFIEDMFTTIQVVHYKWGCRFQKHDSKRNILVKHYVD